MKRLSITLITVAIALFSTYAAEKLTGVNGFPLHFLQSFGKLNFPIHSVLRHGLLICVWVYRCSSQYS